MPDVESLLGGSSTNASEKIVANADRVDYDKAANRLEARGNVHIRNGDDELRADYVRVDMDAEEAEAFGNVSLKRATGTWTGQRVKYNIKTREADCDEATIMMAPFNIKADKIQKVGTNLYSAEMAQITTCSNTLPNVHYRINADKLEIVPGHHFEAHGGMAYLGPVPVLYLPYWYRNLREDIGYRLYPGYSSRMGAFFLNQFRYRMSPELRGATHLDYRTERGVAVGQDFKWRDTERDSFGDLALYYASDDNPTEYADDATDVTSDRYRIRFKQSETFGPKDSLLIQGHYLSDTEILKDFFEDEYRLSRQPDNFAVYTHQEDAYTVNLALRTRLNDFYESVDRLPEASVDFFRQEIGDSTIYYEGKTAVAFLNKSFAESPGVESADNYSALRADSSHTLYYPGKYFGFLSVIPRVGYRATYYSETLRQETSLQPVMMQVTNSVVSGGVTSSVVSTTASGTMQTNTINLPDDANLRSRFELGAEVSYKAFATWDADGVPTRHVIEPYFNYTFVPEPNVLPEQLYQFDSVDTFKAENWLRFGARNLLQVKRENTAVTLVDVDLYSTVLLEKEDGENSLGNIFMDTRLRFVDWMPIDIDSQYDPDEGLTTLNSRMALQRTDLIKMTFEYRFRKDESSLFASEVMLFPNRAWTFDVFGRFEAEESTLEEVGGFIQRTYDCMAIRTGFGFLPGYTTADGREVDDEWNVIIGFWLTGFPGGGMDRLYMK